VDKLAIKIICDKKWHVCFILLVVWASYLTRCWHSSLNMMLYNSQNKINTRYFFVTYYYYIIQVHRFWYQSQAGMQLPSVNDTNVHSLWYHFWFIAEYRLNYRFWLGVPLLTWSLNVIWGLDIQFACFSHNFTMLSNDTCLIVSTSILSLVLFELVGSLTFGFFWSCQIQSLSLVQIFVITRVQREFV